EPLDRYMAFLTVAGDEATGLHFGLYNVETGDVETQNFASLQYETNAVVGGFDNPYVVSFRNNTSVDEWTGSVNLFPNPVERGQKVSLGLPSEEKAAVRVEIVNTLGMVVETLHVASEQTTITAPKVAGVYTLGISVEGKGTCYRKLVVR
ncbi:MAG: T9SS type A sorting domain-containing protein, partial [Bacteroidales bacterium]|nr:T9SS type A sorting domain-containing protein [Bacteroidales bacterium]